MKAILKTDILDDEDYIIKQKGDEIEVEEYGDDYKWEFYPGKSWLLDESEVEVQKCFTD